MKRIINLFLLIWFGMLTAHAVAPKDSISIKTINGKQFIIHKAEKGETLSSISKRYKCSIAEIRNQNKNITKVKVGQKIYIPFIVNTATKIDSIKITVDESHANAESIEVSQAKKHIVQKGETLQKIAFKYKVNAADLMKWNSLKGYTVTAGQEIIVTGNSNIKPYEKWNKTNSLSSKGDSIAPILPSELLIEEIGFPQITDAISHPTLKIGTIVICSNPISNAQKMLLVQHNHALPSGIILGITPEVAKFLQVTNPHQQITLKYLAP